MSLQATLRQQIAAYYADEEIDRALKYYVSTKCQNVAPLLEYEDEHAHAFITKQPLMPFFMEKPLAEGEDRFYLILADAGMGKTTFMLNLYFNYARRLLDVSYKMKLSFIPSDPNDELIADKPAYVRLFPLGLPNILREIEYIPEEDRPRTILMLDAFDEDALAIEDHHQRLHQILNLAKDFAEVIITCRTQFFPADEEEGEEEGVLEINYQDKHFRFRKIYLSPFDEEDIKKYLQKNYPFFSYFKRKKAEQIVRQSPNLMMRPMLLSYVDDLLQNREKFGYSYQIYEALIDRWLDREANRRKGRETEYKAALYRFAQAAALDMCRNSKVREGFWISADELTPLAAQYDITLNELELKSRSLLNLNAKGQYKFAHKSILEYFIAQQVFEAPILTEQFALSDLELAQLFLEEMSHQHLCGLEGVYQTLKFGEALPLTQLSRQTLAAIKVVHLPKITDHDLQALAVLPNLDNLQIADNISLSSTKLSNLLQKRHLDLSNTQLQSLAALQQLSSLKALDLSQNQIQELSGLRRMKALEALNLSANQIKDISDLYELVLLQRLNISNNYVENIYALSDLQALKVLVASFNKLEDVSPLIRLENLEELTLTNNNIPEVDFLKDLPKLRLLDLSNNPISPEQVWALKNPQLKLIFKIGKTAF
ncbi:leucine-rich repeat domain-containing protein [Eisenibacter elegans]|uniref:leucine-rich repeat domain-containing protein n=1 Tax=Eisenibacter elegans TaxID=997 RepID=UPI0004127609|nr:leucine-rich repeat domain-containing protein [Eisenibacter elegans]